MRFSIQCTSPDFSKLFRAKTSGFSKKNIDEAKAELVEMIIEDTDKYVPYDTGYLASSIEALPDNGGVRYTAEYAGYVASMPPSYDFNRTVHPQATPDWVSVSINENRARWIQRFKEVLLGGTE